MEQKYKQKLNIIPFTKNQKRIKKQKLKPRLREHESDFTDIIKAPDMYGTCRFKKRIIHPVFCGITVVCVQKQTFSFHENCWKSGG